MFYSFFVKSKKKQMQHSSLQIQNQPQGEAAKAMNFNHHLRIVILNIGIFNN